MADTDVQDPAQIEAQRRSLLALQPPEPAAVQETTADQGFPKSPPKPDKSAQPQEKLSTDLSFAPVPQLRQYDAPTPQRDQFTSPFDVFKDPMIVLAGLSSLFTRRPLIGAMNYAAGAMKGFHEGQQAVFDQNKVKFDEALKATMEQNKTELLKYNAAWDRRREFNWQKTAPELLAQASASNDQLMIAAIHSGNWDLVEKILVGRETAQLRLDNTIANMNARAEVERNLKPTLSDEAIDQFADQENRGDHSWKIGLGRGIQGKADLDAVMNRAAQKSAEGGQGGQDRAQAGAAYIGEKGYQRTAATYAARVESAVNEAVGLVPQALEASKKLPRGNWVPFNTIYQEWQKGTSDTRYNDFMAANIALLNTYMRAMNPQGVPRITERLEAHAIGLLSMATSQEAYEVQVRRLWKEMQINKEATAKTRQGVGKAEPFPGDTAESPQKGAAAGTKPAFDREAAKKAGYSDAEIDQYLAGKGQ